jgi:hypothetical protein
MLVHHLFALGSLEVCGPTLEPLFFCFLSLKSRPPFGSLHLILEQCIIFILFGVDIPQNQVAGVLERKTLNEQLKL